MWRVDSLEKTLVAGRDWGQEEKGMTEDDMAGWHHGLDGCESEWTLGVGDGQGGLVCCDSWGHKELDTTEWLNWTEPNCVWGQWGSGKSFPSKCIFLLALLCVSWVFCFLSFFPSFCSSVEVFQLGGQFLVAAYFQPQASDTTLVSALLFFQLCFVNNTFCY